MFDLALKIFEVERGRRIVAAPRSGKLALNPACVHGFALSFETFPKTEEQARIARRAAQSFTKNGFRLGGVTIAKKRRAERLSDRKIPGGRLIVAESILCFDGTPPNRNLRS